MRSIRDHVRWFAEIGAGDVELAGGKAANLGELVAAGLPVPTGFVITTDAYRRYADGDDVPEPLRSEILEAYAALGDTTPVAVRSSATAEDLAEASFAGQQETYLNVRGADDLLVAVRQCWASLFTERAVAYRARQGVDDATVALAVVVQTMVEADAAGVMFTANPANGRRDQVAINAAWGLGEAVVSGSVDTDDLVVSVDPWVVRDRRTADKAVQVRYAAHRTEEVPVPPDRRRVPVLDDIAALELAVLGRRTQEHFGAPQDIEWVRSADGFALVQSRPITALRPPEADPPTDWSVPHPKDLYVRASIVEQLPDPLSPLFAELIDSSVTRSLTALVREFVGRGVVRDDDVSMPTVNGYAYYDYSTSGMLRLTANAWRAFPVLNPRGRRSGLTRWRDQAHPAYVATTAHWMAKNPVELTSAELLAGITELLDAGTRYYTAVQTVIPMAATAEIVFTTVYDRLIRRQGDPVATTFLLGGDSAPIRADKSLWDVAIWCREHPALTDRLLTGSAADVVALFHSGSAEGVDAATWAEFGRRFQAHLNGYGHTVYNLDFLHPTAAEEPGPLVEALRFALRGQGEDPYVRQRRSLRQRADATAAVEFRLGRVRGRLFRRRLRAAQEIGPLREDALADVGLAWPRLRHLALELGRRLVAAGVVAEPADVFWLRTVEIRAADGDLREEVEDRKTTWRGQRRVTPPQLLPKGAWFEVLRRVMPAASEDQTGEVIKGIGGSGGRVTGTARVLAGPQDFAQLQPGDILVASITTPAWTTLFSVAGGVVTDIGGPLSHSSIVAREYGIPAVLGTGAATRWAVDGEQLTVDGDAGTVTRAAATS